MEAKTVELTQTVSAASRGKTAASVLEAAREKGAVMVDFKFVDLPGTWQHKSVPIEELNEVVFLEGTGFDGSSIRGFQTIDESDMLIVPDPNTAFMDPFMAAPTLSLTCSVYEPGLSKKAYEKDPRGIAMRAENYLKGTGLADTSYWGPELEFFVFDTAKYHNDRHQAGYHIYSGEDADAASDADGSLGHKIRNKEGYFPVAPHDSMQDLRTEMVMNLQAAGIQIETQHHEVAAAQAEIDMRFDALTDMADKVMLYKYIIKNTAARRGKTATFMPKPVFGDNGTGMHVHQSLWALGKPLFYDEKGYAEMSDMGLYYIGGLLRHAPALTALVAPTTNSYKRLVPGYEAPVNIAFSKRNRSAVARIPMYQVGPKNAKAKRVEFRLPDPSCNPYLAFSAMLMAGLDGVKRKIDPVAEGYGPVETNIYKLSGEDRKKVKNVPGSLDEALDELEADHAFLQEGNVFPKPVLESWMEIKREEAQAVRLRPTPYEFHLYYDA